MKTIKEDSEMVESCGYYWDKLPKEVKPVIAVVGSILVICCAIIISHKLGYVVGFNIVK